MGLKKDIYLKMVEERKATHRPIPPAHHFKSADLHKPGVYAEFVSQCKANHLPIPPAEHIGHAGHHWLREDRQSTGSADMGSLMVAQWSPTFLVWYRSNEIATMAKPISMHHWKWVAAIPVPDTI